jgi:hypothetical protein
VSRNQLSAGRILTIWTLVVLATLVTLGATLTVWTKRQLLDTDEWTRTSSELLADRDVRSVVSQKLVDLLEQQAQGAAPSTSAALESVSARTVDTFLGTAQARALWRQTNRQAHSALVSALEGKSSGPLLTSQGEVVLDLGPLAASVATQLGVPERASHVSGKIVLVRSNELTLAQRAVRAIRAFSFWLALLAVVLYGLALVLARGRRHRVLAVIGVSLVLAGFALLAMRHLVGDAVVEAFVTTASYQPAIRSAWLIETRLLEEMALVLIAYGAAAIGAGFLGGPSWLARGIRRSLVPIFRLPGIVFHSAVILLLLGAVVWGPTTETLHQFGLTTMAGLAAVGIEVWRWQTLREFPAEARTRRRGARSARR